MPRPSKLSSAQVGLPESKSGQNVFVGRTFVLARKIPASRTRRIAQSVNPGAFAGDSRSVFSGGRGAGMKLAKIGAERDRRLLIPLTNL